MVYRLLVVQVQQEALLLRLLQQCSAQHNARAELLHLHKDNQHLHQHNVLHLLEHLCVQLAVRQVLLLQLTGLVHLGSMVAFGLQLVLLHRRNDRRSGV
jgi:hypothetical protein